MMLQRRRATAVRAVRRVLPCSRLVWRQRESAGVVSDGDEGGLAHGVLRRWLPARLWVAVLMVRPERRSGGAEAGVGGWFGSVGEAVGVSYFGEGSGGGPGSESGDGGQDLPERVCFNLLGELGFYLFAAGQGLV